MSKFRVFCGRIANIGTEYGDLQSKALRIQTLFMQCEISSNTAVDLGEGRGV